MQNYCPALFVCWFIFRVASFNERSATLRDDLHWLPIRPRITYKLCTIVYKCLHGAAPSYLTEMCVPVAASTGHRLHSAACGDLMMPRTRTRKITYGSCSFAVFRPRVWNDLPMTLRSSSTTLGQFQSRLKKQNFVAWPMGCDVALSWLLKLLELSPYKCSNILSYLLTQPKTFILGRFKVENVDMYSASLLS